MIANLTISSSSLSHVTSNLERKKLNVVNAGAHGISEAAEQLFSQAQQIVPRKTGALANSGKVTTEERGNKRIAIISYGDYTTNPNTGRATADYAVAKHETPGPGSKWLENTMMGGYDLFMHTMITHISDEL